MHFDDWDVVPNPLREVALRAMLDRHRGALGPPSTWDRMTTHDWDHVPQPIRAMAFMRMVEYWSGYYQVGADFGLRRAMVTDTMSAIVMAESWFEHRAAYTNLDGTSDLGLGGASEYCRATIGRLHRAGELPFAPTDADYADPWRATRVLAPWFDLMIHETRGNLDAAIRAYHRGSPAALRGEGHGYLENVRRKRERFIRNTAGPPAWSFLRAATSRLQVTPTADRGSMGPASDTSPRGGMTE
jgi:hypothetical protein